MATVTDQNRMEVITISVYQVLDNANALEETDGDIICQRIRKALSANQRVILTFLNMLIMATEFLHRAIGQLYKYFDQDFIKNNLSVVDIDSIDLQMLKYVVDAAKAFYPVRLNCRKKGENAYE